MTPAIETFALSKTYGSFRALESLDLRVERGEIFGFLGPNGAGKTTTIRLLMGMLLPSSGRASIEGLDCHAERAPVKKFVGYVPDTPTFHDYLRGSEILRFVAEVHGLRGSALDQRIGGLIEKFGLEEASEEFAVNYSMGMKRRLALALAQLHEPPVFILDEPTNGLDPFATREVHRWISETAAAGRTVFLSTHLLDMAERLCHRVGIINGGQLLAAGTPDELKVRHAPGGTLEEVFFAIASEPGQAP